MSHIINHKIENEFELEKCELGKNIDLKFNDLVDNYYSFGREIEDFYCINLKDKPLFYYPIMDIAI